MIAKSYDLGCDTPDCIAWAGLSLFSVADAEKAARKRGWRCVARKHYCPACVRKLAEEIAKKRKPAADADRVS